MQTLQSLFTKYWIFLVSKKKKKQQQHKNISVHKNKYMSRMLESMEFISDWT